MTFSPFDSPIYGTIYGDNDVRALFTDSAEVRAMLLVEGTLAKVQGELGVIPLESALYIHRASMEVQIDPAGLAAGMAEEGNPIPALIGAFAKAMEAPEHSKFIHWGANTQDIMDTALVLRLRQYLRIVNVRMEDLRSSVKDTSLMTSLDGHIEQLQEFQAKLLLVRFNDVSNTANLDDRKSEVGEALAEALKLSVSTSSSISMRVCVEDLFSIISQIIKTLDGLGQEAPETIQSVALSTMSRFCAVQSDMMRRTLADPLDQQDVNLALEKWCWGRCVLLGVLL